MHQLHASQCTIHIQIKLNFPLVQKFSIHPRQGLGTNHEAPSTSRAVLDPTAPEQPPSASGPAVLPGGAGLWPNSSAGNCSLCTSVPPADAAAFISCPELRGGVAACCETAAPRCPEGLGCSLGSGWVRHAPRMGRQPATRAWAAACLPTSPARFGHCWLPLLFLTRPKSGQHLPLFWKRPWGNSAFLQRLPNGRRQRVNAGGFSRQTGDPCEFYGEGSWGREGHGGGKRICFMALTGTPIMV